MKKKILSIILGTALIMSVLSGCGNTDTVPSSANAEVSAVDDITSGDSSATADNTNVTPTEFSADMEVTPVTLTDDMNQNTSEYNKSLIEFVENNGMKDKNYMISPTSLRAALAITVAGADTETKEQLLNAMGFNSMDEVNEWYTSVANSVAFFNQWIEESAREYEMNKEYYGDEAKAPDGAFNIQNSIWRNTKSSGLLSQKYMDYVAEHFAATADNADSDTITDKVNNWINEGTNGLIPKISEDLSFADLILVNTIYLRSSWIKDFSDADTAEGDFHTLSGKDVKKDFMWQKDRFLYYEDEKGKFVVLPMNGGINAVFVLGDVEDVAGKIKEAKYEQVSLTIPKFENDTSFNQNEMIAYLQSRGAILPFTIDADFSLMSDDMSLYISDIIQKTKIKVDEDGIEAAAATAVMLLESAAVEDPEFKVFTADQPFKYMIMTDNSEAPELLFYGQIVE